MSKPWHEKPLWEKVWRSGRTKVYIHAAKIINHAGCSAFAFYDAAKLLPGYDKRPYEDAVRDLTVHAQREQGRYELHATARKVMRIILGPAPDDLEYAAWWRARLVSVKQMKEAGQAVEWAEAPPVPIEEPNAEEPPEKPAKKRRKVRG